MKFKYHFREKFKIKNIFKKFLPIKISHSKTYKKILLSSQKDNRSLYSITRILIYFSFSCLAFCPPLNLPVLLAAINPTFLPAGVSLAIVEGLPTCC